jgi:hypothetical protein
VSRLDEIVSRLEQIDEELAELAIDRLKISVVDNDADAAAEERRITKARRRVEQAAGILAGMPEP